LPIFFDDAQAAVLGDTVLHVDNVISHGQIAEVGDEGGGLGLSSRNRTGLHIRVIRQIVCSEKYDLTCCSAAIRIAQIEHLNAIRNGSADE
jgi:hypothetical protein